MLKTMKMFTITARPETLAALDNLAKKYNTQRTRVTRALIVLALRDKDILQKAIDIL